MDLDAAIDNDEIDQLNDETFGADILEGGDWEEEHEKLAEEVEIDKLGNEADKLQLSDQLHATYGGAQNDLEKSISQLVKDEEDEELDDPAIMAVKRTMPIPMASRSHHDTFKASSPPPFADTLDNLLHPDSDIWGSPAKHNPTDLHLLDLITKPSDGSGSRLHDSWESSKQAAVVDVTMHDSGSHLASAVGVEPYAGSSPNMQPPHRAANNGHAGMGGGGDWLRPPPGFQVAANLNTILPDFTRPPPNMAQPLFRHSIPLPFRAATMSGPQAAVRGPIYQSSYLDWHQQQMLQSSPTMANALLHQQFLHSANIRNRVVNPLAQRSLPPGLYGMPLRGATRGTYFPHVPVPPLPLQIVKPPASPAGMANVGNITDGCIMTRSEKEWVIKIQMQQLHTDDPFIDDFYFTLFTQKKRDLRLRNQQAAGGGDGPMELIVPAKAKLETKEYKPVQFEGTLGKLAVSSIHKPRQVLDVSGGAHDEGKHAVHRNQRYREALMHIERSFDKLLEAEELEKKVLSVPDVARHEMLRARETIIQQLYERMSSPEHLLAYLSVHKGKLLFGRLLPILTKVNAQALLCSFYHHLPNVLKKDATEKVLPLLLESIIFIIGQSDLRALVAFAEAIRKHLVSSLQTSFVSSVVAAMLLQAETAYLDHIDDEADTDTKWREFVKTWASCVLNKAVAAPVDRRGLKALPAHAARFLDDNEIDCIQQLVAAWQTAAA